MTGARRLATGAALIFGSWTLYAIFTASQNYVSSTYGSSRVSWTRALSYSAVDAYPWALLTPLAFLIAGRLILRRANWWWTLPLLLVAGIAIGVVHMVVFVRLLPFLGYPSTNRFQGSVYVGKFHSDVLTCWTLFAIRHGIEYYRRYRIRELTASQLETKLAVAQIEMLKMQLQPHFLFNTLHAISALMYRDVESADRVVTRLSDFLRLTLDSSGVQEVPLKREMEYLDKYLDIEQIRFGDRLEVRRLIDPDALDMLVPNLVLQPLVENAVRHGIAPRASGGCIAITARAEGKHLTIEVLDNGAGAREIHEGIGLANTRARIEHLYGPTARLDIGNAAEGGFTARLTLPAHTEPRHASPDRR